MRIVDLNVVHEWLRSRALLDAHNEPSLEDFPTRIRIAIPRDAGRRTHLGRVFAGLVVDGGEGLLWIDEFGIWPSSENRLIFHALRNLVGEQRPLPDAPGHLFSIEDREILEALIATALYFSWGGWIARANSELVIRISHDEYAIFYCRTDELRQRLAEMLRIENIKAGT